MIWLTITTKNGKTVEKWVIDAELADFYIQQFLKAEDTKHICYCDGLTGEILREYYK